MGLLVAFLVLAIGASFLCSILEAVLLSVSASYIEQLKHSRPKGAARLEAVKTNLDESLSSILIVNTFAHTMGAAGVGSQALKVFGEKWETLIAVLLTLAILYFSEIIPKTLGATFWRFLAVPSAYVIYWLTLLVFPLVWFSTRLTRFFNRYEDNEITREEIIAMASLGRKEGTIFEQENAYLLNLLKLRDIRTESILTPRSVVHALPDTLTVKEALDAPESMQFSRIPVFHETIDQIVGIVMRVDLFEAERKGEGEQLLTRLVKPVLHVSEKLPVQALLDLLIKKRAHLCIVEDEYGQTAGIVTLEDAIETLLGREIIDERDRVVDMQALAKERLRARKMNRGK